MNSYKTKILDNICYTELVYGRINKKLSSNLLKVEVENVLFKIIKETDNDFFNKIGKNIYVSNSKNNIKITINFNTCRVITVDKIKK